MPSSIPNENANKHLLTQPFFHRHTGGFQSLNRIHWLIQILELCYRQQQKTIRFAHLKSELANKVQAFSIPPHNDAFPVMHHPSTRVAQQIHL